MHVPGWHAATVELQRQGRVQMLGIVQEQNPDRARLFMQWRRMEWPILIDTFDLLEVSVVPLTFAIDEHGIVRAAGLRLADAAEIERSFLDRSWPAPRGELEEPALGELERLASRAPLAGPETVSRLIAAYEERIASPPDDPLRAGWDAFRLAVAYRLRYDSSARRPGDFQRAADQWQRALELDPNNYIWRRRIQQYGPRLAKPYPFYDWIETARREVRARGEQPVPLVSEPTGSEIAQPSREPITIAEEMAEPDPQGRIRRDGPERRLIEIETAVVPPRIEAGGVVRVHFVFRPNRELRAHWNNETEPLALWLQPPAGWRSEARLFRHPQGEGATSTETRIIEAELAAPETVPAETAVSVSGYALYSVCEDADGTCLYRRQDVRVQVVVRPTPD